MTKLSLHSGLGVNLRTHRKARRLTQGALATRAGVTMPTVRLLENTRGTLASFDAVLGVLNLRMEGRNLPAAATVGESIAALRKARGLNQRQLAELVDVTQPTITALERYGRGRLEILNRVLTRLGAGAYLAAPDERKAFYTHAGNASTSHDWETPAHILEALYTVYRRFHLDPCSPRRSKPPVKARMHYTREDDGLSLPWHGVCFMNPPYGRQLSRWIAKAHAEVECGNASTVIALIPARPDTAYWHKYIARKAVLYFIEGRLRFSRSKQSAPFPSVLAVWGADAATLEKLDLALPFAYREGSTAIAVAGSLASSRT